MFDLYLFNTVINTLWYLFTILFVLYKYTAFFSYIYNFVKFCGKLFSGVSYVYKYISGNNNLNRVDIESQNNQNNKSLYQKCKNYITKNYNYYYRKIFPNSSVQVSSRNINTFIPLVETNYSSQIKFSTQLNTSNEDVFRRQSNSNLNENNFDYNKIKELEQKLFINKMNELQKSELEQSELEQKYNIQTHEYTSICEDNDEKYFDENIKTDSILKNVTFNEKLNVSYELQNNIESDIESDIAASDIDSNSELTLFYDL